MQGRRMTQSYAARAVGRGVFSQPLLYCQHFRRMHILCGCVEVTPRLVHAYHRWSPRSSCTVPEPKAITPLSHFSRVLCAKVRTVSSMAMLWGYGKVHQSPGPTAHQKKMTILQMIIGSTSNNCTRRRRPLMKATAFPFARLFLALA